MGYSAGVRLPVAYPTGAHGVSHGAMHTMGYVMAHADPWYNPWAKLCLMGYSMRYPMVSPNTVYRPRVP